MHRHLIHNTKKLSCNWFKYNYCIKDYLLCMWHIFLFLTIKYTFINKKEFFCGVCECGCKSWITMIRGAAFPFLRKERERNTPNYDSHIHTPSPTPGPSSLPSLNWIDVSMCSFNSFMNAKLHEYLFANCNVK
jgi:hypothetical protein